MVDERGEYVFYSTLLLELIIIMDKTEKSA